MSKYQREMLSLPVEERVRRQYLQEDTVTKESLRPPTENGRIPGDDCYFPDCRNKRVKGHLCSGHLQQHRRHGVLKPLRGANGRRRFTGVEGIDVNRTGCIVIGCDRLAKGVMCHAHHHRYRSGRRGAALTAPIRPYRTRA